MTDEQIIKALQLCTGGDIYCKDCPYTDVARCRYVSLVDALDLIMRQRVEIKNLKDLNNVLETDNINANMNLEHLQYEFDLLRQEKSVVIAEAIKEFVERVHTEIEAAITSNRKVITARVSSGVIPQGDVLCKYCYGNVHALEGIDDYIADLVKEFTEEQT